MEQIIITDEVYQSILTHALMTDAEEILGLLFGQAFEKTVTIYASQSLVRNCKTKDRVEVDEVQLSSAITEAEKIASQINQPTTLTGWYHSHPNITVFPSNVDINTQKNYQRLSDEFVGLIVSIERSKISLIGFQSIQINEMNNLILKAKQIPIQIMSKQNVCPQLKLHDFYDAVVEFLQNFYQEEVANYQKQQTQNVLKKVHSAALYQQMLCELLEQVAMPLMQALEDQLNESKVNQN